MPSSRPPLDPRWEARKAACATATLRASSGRTITYFVEGSDDDPTVLCFHGAPGNHLTWVLKEPLRGVRIVSFTRSGYGLGSSPVDFRSHTLRDTVDDVRSLVDQLGLQRFFVVGYSMGAAAVMCVAAALPDR
eukprot:7067055-Prymnesium_polylepis.1